MEQTLVILSVWLHVLATVVLIGHYLLLGLVYLPVLEKQFRGVALGKMLDEIGRKMQPWVGYSLLAFLFSGVYLMMTDTQYPGFGRIFANTWTMLMVVKHILVLVMIGLGTAINMITRKGLAESEKAEDCEFEALPTLKKLLMGMNASGAAVLLLTAVAQGY